MEANKCCIIEKRKLWEEWGSSMNIIHITFNCPVCNDFNYLHQISKEEANKILKEYKLKPL